MDEVILTIDGVEVKAERGKAVLKAAQQAGIYIPGYTDFFRGNYLATERDKVLTIFKNLSIKLPKTLDSVGGGDIV